MGALLIDQWLGALASIQVLDEASVSVVRDAIRALGAGSGMPRNAVETAALVASELAHNQLAHARGGAIGFGEVDRDGVPGIEIVAADRGDGIRDPSLALEGEASSRSLGAGLSGARRMAHEMDFDVRWGEGTCVRARVYAEPIRRGREIGILGRPHGDESVSGDQAYFVRSGGRITVAVVDGLGHGPLARNAADAAIGVIAAGPSLTPADALAAVDAALRGTRGGVMTVACIEGASMCLQLAAGGNVTTRIERRKTPIRTYLGTPFVLGAPTPALRKPRIENALLDREDTLIVFTDGLSTRTMLGDEAHLAHAPPIVIAQWLLARFGRANDDALVLVAR